MSALVRARYFYRPIMANTDQVMIRELRRVGGLLKNIHVESDGACGGNETGSFVPGERSDQVDQPRQPTTMIVKKPGTTRREAQSPRVTGSELHR